MMTQMKKFLSISALSALIALSPSCKPDQIMGALDNFQLTLNSDIFNYRLTLELVDEMGQPLQNAEVFVEGRDEAKIFSELGTKSFFVSNGAVTFAVHPGMEPQAGDTVKFSVLITAPGHESGSVELAIPEGQFSSTESAGLYAKTNLPEFLKLEDITITASNGTVGQGSLISGKNGSDGRMVKVMRTGSLDSVYYDTNRTSVLILQGAQFWYWKQYLRPVRPKLYQTFFDTAVVNGETVAVQIKEFVGYGDDTNWVPAYTREVYTGDVLDVEISITNREDKNYRIIGGNSDRQINTAIEGEVARNRVFMDYFTYNRINWLRYLGKDDEGKPITIYPKRISGGEHGIYYSSVIDSTRTNPLTGNLMKEGDTVEVGTRYVGSNQAIQTVKAAVLRAPNGELRVQSPYPVAGFFRYMPYSSNWNYNIDFTPPTNVPDLNNLRSYVWVEPFANSTQSVGLDWHPITETSGNRSYQGALVSEQPMSASPKLVVETDYWYKYPVRKEFNSASGSFDAFNDDDFNSLPAITSYDVEVYCAANDSVRILPSVSARAYVDGYYTNINLVNGNWKTRGVQLNDQFNITLEYQNFSLDTTFIVEQAENLIQYVAETNDDVCDF